MPELAVLGLAAAAVVALALSFAPLRSTAANFLAIFEPHTFVPIGVTHADLASLRGLPELAAFGTSQHSQEAPRVETFADPRAAARFLGQSVLRPRYLPAQFGSGVQVHVLAAHSGAFTFDAAKARASA